MKEAGEAKKLLNIKIIAISRHSGINFRTPPESGPKPMRTMILLFFVAVCLHAPAHAQDYSAFSDMPAAATAPIPVHELTKDEQNANRERVKAEQKFLAQQEKQEKKNRAQAANSAPTWTVIEATPGDIKGALIGHMRQWGYSVDSESEHQISFWKEARGKDAFVATLFMGNRYSENPKKHIQFTLTPDEPGKTRVDIAGAVTVKMAFGKENRVVTTNSTPFKQDTVQEFTALKSWADNRKKTETAEKSAN